MEDRITDLEMRFMHQERTIQEMSDLIFRQQQAIDRLEEEMGALRRQFLTVAPSLVKRPEEEEPPPHY